VRCLTLEEIPQLGHGQVFLNPKQEARVFAAGGFPALRSVDKEFRHSVVDFVECLAGSSGRALSEIRK
jgi:hypothetical protein